MSGTDCLWAGCYPCHQTNNVTALMETRSIDRNQWLALPSSITRLTTKAVLMPLCLFSNASIYKL